MAEQEKQEKGTVLVVDDDRMILRTLRGILEGAGYRVIEREDGGEGAEVFRDQHEEIDVVIMDWIMPGLDGDEWVLNGEKIFVTSGIRCKGVVVWATIDPAAGRGGPWLIWTETAPSTSGLESLLLKNASGM